MRNRQNLLRNKSLTFWGHLKVFSGQWRLFLCLVIAIRTYGITKSKASNTQADDGYKKIRRKHTQALHSQDFCKQISM